MFLPHPLRPSLVLIFFASLVALPSYMTAENAACPNLFARSNLVAWCIVPFDSAKRNPEQRSQMLVRHGLRHFAYDYRAEHIPTFDAEMDNLKTQGIHLTAWWFPTELNAEARSILDLLKRRKIQTQLWVTGGGKATGSPTEQKERVESEAKRIKVIADEAGKIGCSVALYNHGGWFGEPENQIAIIEHLKKSGLTNIGIVYNQHHGHDHIDRFPELLQKMKPYLWVLNLNGMIKNGDKIDRKILPIGQGNLDSQLIGAIQKSGWCGPIGILNHTDEDAELRLLDNIAGLEWVATQLEGNLRSEAPKPRTWREK